MKKIKIIDIKDYMVFTPDIHRLSPGRLNDGSFGLLYLYAQHSGGGILLAHAKDPGLPGVWYETIYFPLGALDYLSHSVMGDLFLYHSATLSNLLVPYSKIIKKLHKETYLLEGSLIASEQTFEQLYKDLENRMVLSDASNGYERLPVFKSYGIILFPALDPVFGQQICNNHNPQYLCMDWQKDNSLPLGVVTRK